MEEAKTEEEREGEGRRCDLLLGHVGEPDQRGNEFVHVGLHQIAEGGALLQVGLHELV